MPAGEAARFAMVLNDGETYTGLAGCKIVEIPDQIEEAEEEEFIKDACSTNSPSVITEFGIPGHPKWDGPSEAYKHNIT